MTRSDKGRVTGAHDTFVVFALLKVLALPFRLWQWRVGACGHPHLKHREWEGKGKKNEKGGKEGGDTFVVRQ